MPTTIRTATFETNSSSAHALCVMSPEQFDSFQRGGCFLHFDALRDWELPYSESAGAYDSVIGLMAPRAVGFADMPVAGGYTLVPADQVDDYVAANLDEWSKDGFYEPSYQGEQPYWWSHQSAGLMTYEDMAKGDWHGREWPQVEVLDNGYVQLYYSFEV